ncbi:MAG: hypothetical protein H7A41_05960 [Chlamydiales bacterium]|nr:hypothetical protein [Chlamydiia bacterium]MCP5504681.1 hypothetical protein [Chlamydiales bacterium]
MNRTSIKDIVLFLTFWNLSSLDFSPLSFRQCAQNKKRKTPQKLKKSNQPFNAGSVHAR